MIKKLRYLAFFFLLIAAIVIYNKASTYDANHPEASLNAMVYLIPNSEHKKQFLHDFLAVAIDDRGTNLHGLTKDEIHALTQKNYK